MGMASGELRQALAVVGPDEESAKRWSSLFRESWRQSRLEVRQTSFERAMDPAVLPALVVPRDFDDAEINARLLPVSAEFCATKDARDRLREAMRQHDINPDGHNGLGGIDWASIAKELRAGKTTEHESIRQYRQILIDLGLYWIPIGPILPSHGNMLAAN